MTRPERALVAMLDGALDVARAEAARRHLDDLDDNLSNLLAAIEAGAPADLLAPRLQQLRAESLAEPA